MGWGFRKSIKIAPGIRINLSKSGISTSIGGKGFTYNTRGRITTSIPGTGIRYTTNLKGRESSRRDSHGTSESTGTEHMNTENLSKREQATQDFVYKVQSRTTNALRQYFISHGVYVEDDDISEAVKLEAFQPFLNTLAHDLALTTKAIKLAVDIGTVSLAEKEKAMLAVYEMEHKCLAAQGPRGELQTAASALMARVRAWPSAPGFVGPLFAALLGCFLMAVLSVPVGLALTGFALAYGGYKTFSFMRKKAVSTQAIKEANEWFQSELTVEVTPRPAIRSSNDYVALKAAASATVTAAAVIYAIIVYPHRPVSNGNDEQATLQSATAADGSNGVVPAAANSTTLNAAHPVPDFGWLVGKYPSDVVNDKRFRSAFNGVSRADWKKIAERLAVVNSSGIQMQDGYLVAQGCKEHECSTEQAAFAINPTSGKGVMLVKQTSNSSGNASIKTFHWPDLPVGVTPLSSWAQEVAGTDAAPSAQTASFQQTSFDCSKALSDAEHIICSDAELASDDVRLAAIYAKAKAVVDDPVAFKERTRAQWNYREQQCHERECLVRWYADQNVALVAIAETGKVAQ
ncbi:DUF4236 domain-containing protein [Paraburkholderia phenoliruptrix]|uniref:DUF4236 domain-containing protein n=1 Tax=Paraburkholderia phenoliruptrix TaxID=252970 RepID=UPI0028699700|nr:DUF4236 domain-containing protein [Paraburkholderia phenoliruptrix]WMY07273.1 DUF4236 domain-containing protein [Paraburkholderia phenoliruptrix]